MRFGWMDRQHNDRMMAQGQARRGGGGGWRVEEMRGRRLMNFIFPWIFPSPWLVSVPGASYRPLCPLRYRSWPTEGEPEQKK